MNELIPVASGRVPQLYDRMHTAIAQCFKVDDCKKIADEATAIAAYYKQIKDDASVKRFIQIKIRAWRRIGQIIITVSNEYQPGAETQAKYCERTRKRVDTGDLSDAQMIQAVRLAQLPDGFFELNAENARSVDWLLNGYRDIQQAEWRETPEGKAEAERRRYEQEEADLAYRERQRQEAEEKRKRAIEEAAKLEDYRDYIRSRDEAFGDVGVTMDRRDRKEMKEIVFLIKRPVYERLRQAAFDKRMTQQAVLRAGLRMWFAAHDYDTSDLEAPPPLPDPSITSLKLSIRAINCLQKAGIETIGQLIALRTIALYRIEGLGEITRDEVINAVHERGLKFEGE